MAEPGLITRYQAELAAHLPAQIAGELADGLRETHRHYLGQGLAAEAAAEAAIAESGEPQVILAAFIRDSPARRAARKLLATGPAVGGCWAAALITGRAWTWPAPAGARTVFAATLITAIGLLTLAALGGRYRAVRRAAAAGCAAVAALDTAMLIFVTLAIPAITWPLILAATERVPGWPYTVWGMDGSGLRALVLDFAGVLTTNMVEAGRARICTAGWSWGRSARWSGTRGSPRCWACGART